MPFSVFVGSNFLNKLRGIRKVGGMTRGGQVKERFEIDISCMVYYKNRKGVD
ncbi:MAG: hypothetical protein AB1610_00320 [Nitrospirota bacterium]